DELMALAVIARDAARDVADALDAADRRAAVFLDDQCHCILVGIRGCGLEPRLLARRPREDQIFRNASVALVPPKPNELESADRMDMSRATRGTKSRSQSGSTLKRFAVGGASWSRNAS